MLLQRRGCSLALVTSLLFLVVLLLSYIASWRIVGSLSLVGFAPAALQAVSVAEPTLPVGVKQPQQPQQANPWVTSQLCYQLVDDSEFCVYEGPICIADDATIAVSVDLTTKLASDAERTRWGLGVRNARYAGPQDRRHFEFVSPTFGSERTFASGGSRHVTPAFEGGDAAYGAVLPFSVMPMQGRRFGPLGGGGRMLMVPAAAIAHATSTADAASSLGERWVATQASTAAYLQPYDDWGGPSVHIRVADRGYPPSSITWLNGSLFVADICSLCFVHPWHASIALGQLWAIARMNATEPLEAQPHGPLRRGRRALQQQAAAAAAAAGSPPWMRHTHASGHVFPPIDNLYLRGWKDGHLPTPNISVMSDWNRELLRLMVPRGTDLWFQDRVREFRAAALARVPPPPSPPLPPAAAAPARDPADAHWICAPRGVVLGEKSAVFTGVGDAHALRVAAYVRAGVDPALAWRARPPQTITLVQRPKSRKFTNGAAVEALLRATGLPVTVIPDPGALPWAEQVALFAHTGVLVAAHGGALMNIMFMPVHSVLIEIFPFPLTVEVYSKLAAMCRVRRYGIKGLRVPSQQALEAFSSPYGRVVNGSDYRRHCDNGRMTASERRARGWNLTHLSTLDVSLLPACNPYAKMSDIEVPLEVLRWTMDSAVDDIGCRDSICRVDEDDAVVARQEGDLRLDAPAEFVDMLAATRGGAPVG